MTVFESMSPAERSLRGQAAAHQSWANTPDPQARTLPMRQAAAARFERQVDPDGVLDAAERARRAEAARRAHLLDMSRKAAKAAREKRERSAK